MILYHGSNIAVAEINLDLCKPFKDFGQGFYLTTIKSQTEQMTNRTSRIYGGDPIISIFDFDDSSIEKLSIRTFATHKPIFVPYNQGNFAINTEGRSGWVNKNN